MAAAKKAVPMELLDNLLAEYWKAELWTPAEEICRKLIRREGNLLIRKL